MRSERGQALILVLALLAIGAVLIIPFLQIASTAVKSRQMYGQYIKEDFAADAAIEYGMWRLKYESGFATSLPAGIESQPFYITLNGVDASTTVLAQVQAGMVNGQTLAGLAFNEPYKVTKTVVASSTYLSFAADGFESANGSGGTGTWIGNWTLSGDYQFSTYSSYAGTYHLRLIGDDNSSPGDGAAQRRVNLSGSTGAGPFLNFWAKVESFESGDTAQVKVSTNGTNWAVLNTFTSSISDNQWHFYQYDLSSYGRPANLYLAFATNLSSNHDYLHIDAVSFSSNQEATVIQPGVITDYTYYVTIECMNPLGGTRANGLALARIIDDLPNRGASSGDYLQYITGSTNWDQAEWGIPPFNPTRIENSDWGSSLHQSLQWDFTNAGYQDVEFAYGEIKTMSFKARAALTQGVYLNKIDTSVNYDHSDIIFGGTAKIVVGTPADTRGTGGLLTIDKTADPLVLYPDEPTTITYTIDIKNVDTVPITIYEVEDWLPSTGSSDRNQSFVYVPNSAHGAIIGRNSFPDLFYDTFNRSDSNTVSYWIDSDGSGSNAAIHSNYVRMRTSASITQPNISTVGYTSIVFSYQWSGNSYCESTDKLLVEWKPSSSGTWNPLAGAGHALNTTYWHAASWNLPVQANNTHIDIRFTGNTNVSDEYALVDDVQVTSTVPISYTPVGMPDTNVDTDFLAKTWQSNPIYYRWSLNWDFNNYPAQTDPVWDEGGLCEGYSWADYHPYLLLQPGETFRVVFQATVTLTASGSYYDEVFVRINEDYHYNDAWLYSWPMGEVSVPQYDLQAQTLNSILRANALLTSSGHWWRSWHWKEHR